MKTRRDILKAAALTGLASACGRGPMLERRPGDGPTTSALPSRWERMSAGEVMQVSALPESQAFPLGISSGDVSSAGVMLQCRYTGLAPLEVSVWSDTAMLTLETTPADYGFVHVEVTGLQPDTYYSYAFVERRGDDQRSPIGRFRSAMKDDALQPVTLGAVSCTDTPNDLSALRHASERDDLAAFLLLGDTVYADGATTLQQYRDKWQGSLSRPLYRALRQQVPLISTWDDHEVANDWNSESLDMVRIATARSSFFEHLPIRRDALEPDRVWKSIRFGHTVEVFVLDSRSERKPSSGGTTYLSEQQLNWLKAGLLSSPCAFKLLMNSVPITQFPFSNFSADSWISYAAQRTELLEFIDANVEGVLWVSGDHHFASVGRVASSGPGSGQLEVLAGPGAQTSNPLWLSCRAPQFDWAAGDNNYLAMHFDPIGRQVRLLFWGQQGQLLHDRAYTL